MPTCHSTNLEAERLLNSRSVDEGTLVITDHQTRGSGQGGNSWESQPKKNLTFSIILRPSTLDLRRIFYLNIVASLSVSDAVDEIAGVNPLVKWPNDIMLYEKKISGVLIKNLLRKNKIENSIVGIGLNVNQKKFKDPNAGSLLGLTNMSFNLHKLLDSILFHLNKYYALLNQGKFEELRLAYLSSLYWLNQQHIFKSEFDFKGKITGIDSMGRLEVKTEQGLKKFNFKEIKYIK